VSGRHHVLIPKQAIYAPRRRARGASLGGNRAPTTYGAVNGVGGQRRSGRLMRKEAALTSFLDPEPVECVEALGSAAPSVAQPECWSGVEHGPGGDTTAEPYEAGDGCEGEGDSDHGLPPDCGVHELKIGMAPHPMAWPTYEIEPSSDLGRTAPCHPRGRPGAMAKA
jgi:hypothetical protein